MVDLVTLKVSDKLRVYNYTEDVQNMVINLCTYENPEYTGNPYGKSKWAYLHNTMDDHIECPRGVLRDLYDYLKKNDIKFELVNERLKCEEMSITFNKELWQHQSEAVDVAVKRSQGVIVSPAGSGKTVIGCAIIARVKQPTLWITHKIELLEQTKKELLSCTDLKEENIGMLGDDFKYEGDKVTIGTVQTLCRMDLTEVVNNYGCVIVDEVHHCPAETWNVTINKFPAHYRFGLTATMFREDGLVDLINRTIGRTIYEVSRKTLVERGKILPAKVFTITNSTVYEYDDSNKKTNANHKLTEDIINDPVRNNMITKLVAMMSKKNDQILVLSERVEHVLELTARIKAELAEVNDTTHVEEFHAKHNVKLDELPDKYILVATYQKAEEGLNLKHLNSLVFATATKNERKIVQSIGRAERIADGKPNPNVIDIIDAGCGVTMARWNKRREIYYNMGLRYTDITDKLNKAA